MSQKSAAGRGMGGRAPVVGLRSIAKVPASAVVTTVRADPAESGRSGSRGVPGSRWGLRRTPGWAGTRTGFTWKLGGTLARAGHGQNHSAGRRPTWTVTIPNVIGVKPTSTSPASRMISAIRSGPG